MSDRRTAHLVFALADPVTRSGAARRLARRLRARALVVLVRDPEIDALVPAPGLPAGLPGGPAWRALLARCATRGRHVAVVPHPDDAHLVTARACVSADGTALIAIGMRAHGAHLASACAALSRVSAALRAELAGSALRARVAVAESAEIQARALAASLEDAKRDLTRALAEADARSAALQRAARDKDDFLAMLGHELRNPLAPIMLALHLIPKKRQAGDAIDQELAILTRQTAHLSRIVDDLLEVARITRGKISLQCAPITLHAVISQAVEASRPLLETRGHALGVSLPPEAVWLHADPVRLVQVFANLLNNAAKYTDPGGHVAIEARRRGPRVEVAVVDDGIGIPSDVLPHIFDVFVQAPRALDRSEGGLGLGLPLVRGIVELHGGEVAAKSGGRDAGTEVVVRLPLAEPPASSVSALPPPEVATSVERVLIVEDNADAAAMLEQLIAGWGCDVRVAHDGEEAMRDACAFHPSTIVLDIGLPGISGYDLARWAREEMPGARLIAVTGYSSPKDRAAALAAGVAHHFAKPVDPASLREVLRVSER